VNITFDLNGKCDEKLIIKARRFVRKDSFSKWEIDSVCKAARISESRAPFRPFRSFSRRWCHASLAPRISGGRKIPG